MSVLEHPPLIAMRGMPLCWLQGRDAKRGSTGNYGIQDQRLSLQWVQNNIK